jgi:hypothetical protein
MREAAPPARVRSLPAASAYSLAWKQLHEKHAMLVQPALEGKGMERANGARVMTMPTADSSSSQVPQ